MVNLPDSLLPDVQKGGGAINNNNNTNSDSDNSSKVIDWPSATVDELLRLLPDPQHRQRAIQSLTHIKKQGTNKDLALQIWQSSNTVFLLLLEVMSVYKSFTPEKLTMKDSSRVCDALALFECLATHPETKLHFIKVQVHCYLYPFMMTEETSKPFQYLRLMSLGVLGGLLKEVDFAPTAVHYLLESGIFPLCLRCIEFGDELSQSTASWIVSRVLIQEEGLHYCSKPVTRLFAVLRVFKIVIEKMDNKPSTTVLKNIIQCYLILSEIPRGCFFVRSFFPSILMSATFVDALRERPVTFGNFQELIHRLATESESNAEPINDI